MQAGVLIGLMLLGVGTLLAFRRLPPRRAALTVFFGGWLFAPVGVFPPGPGEAAFPYWIVGSALPSDMLWQKAWLVPCVVLAAALAFDRASLRRFRPSWIDAPVIAWCAWPLLQSLAVDAPQPKGVMASLYLFASWGTTWCIGRVYARGVQGRLDLLRALAVTGVACLPFALLEGLAGAQAYGWVFGQPHPFRDDGAVRYLGWRPVGFFEHGNQYGIWVALCGLAALWLAWRRAEQDRRWRIVAVLAVAIALAAQSAGALLLALAGAAALAAAARVSPRRLVLAPLIVGVVASVIYVSGVVPVTRLANDTAIGRTVVGAIKATGRGSFTWRVAQDQRALPLATARPLVGTGQWDWWRPQGSRPWGLAMLTLGQFGAIGLLLAAAALLAPVLRAAWSARSADPRSPAALPWLLALLVLLAMQDALLNSFVFLPALLIAGALASDA
jgi:O-Antigen ligase